MILVLFLTICPIPHTLRLRLIYEHLAFNVCFTYNESYYVLKFKDMEGKKGKIREAKSKIREVKSRMDKMNPEKKEGMVATIIEDQTAKIPSDIWLWASFATMGTSLALKLLKKDSPALFIGLWTPAFLLFGVYNKLVKQSGHDSKTE